MEDGFSEFRAKFSSLDDKFSSLDAKFSSLDAKFSSLDAKFSSLEDSVSSLRAEVVKGFSSQANFERTRALLAVEISRPYAPSGCDNALTAHLVEIRGVLVVVTAAHARCSGVAPAEVVTCPTIDVAFVAVDNYTHAQQLKFNFTTALNIRRNEMLEWGAPAVGFGFWGTTGVVHAGVMSGQLVTMNREIPCVHWNGCWLEGVESIVVSGNTMPGTSGGPNFNCCRCGA